MLTNANPLVSEMFDLYKNNSNKIIEILEYDQSDVLFHLAKAASVIKDDKWKYFLGISWK